MMRLSSKAAVARFVSICQKKGVRHVVISPGSRNAPLIIGFSENPDFKCINIPDERVAAFFALGISNQLNEPVVLCCTSGSALLNYAPAIAEAYYQKISLLVVSADRPIEWIDQKVGQTIRQQNVFSNYIKASFEINAEIKDKEIYDYWDRITNKAIDICTESANCGPVHINFSLAEPLYESHEAAKPEPRIIKSYTGKRSLSGNDWDELIMNWRSFKSILILVGQHRVDPELARAIERISVDSRVIIMTETTSNVAVPMAIQCIDRTIEGMAGFQSFAPELILSIGGNIVSKKIRQLLRQMRIEEHWYIDEYESYIDTYRCLRKNILADPVSFLNLLPVLEQEQNTYKNNWLKREAKARRIHEEFLKKTPWSDLKLFDLSLFHLRDNCVLHFANSTPVRYSQLFDEFQQFECHSNRGVSGIDGCSSTAAGMAYSDPQRIHFLFTGDTAFFYDSNAYWNRYFPANLRVILINNGGGGIFRFIPGPSTTRQLEEHFESHHDNKARGIAESFGVNYKWADDPDGCVEGIHWLWKSGVASILELKTPRELNDVILKNYFNAVKES